MKSLLFFVFFFLLGYSSASFSEIENYSTKDFESTVPFLIFIYYDSPNSTCLACGSYKKWLSSFPNKSVGAFTIKKINFNTSPILALRFRATRFPTFFLQHKKRFKDISNVDLFDQIHYGKLYENEIDAILKNPRILDSIETLEGYRAPSSIFSWLYAYSFTASMMIVNILDRITESMPFWFILLVLSILAAISIAIRRISVVTEQKKNS